MSIMLTAGWTCAFTGVAYPAMWRLSSAWRLGRKNFRGDVIPTGFGFMTVLASAPVYVWMHSVGDSRSSVTTCVAAVIGFGLLGLLDDVRGSREVGGFGGHFGLLLKGKVTTGLAKAIGGGLLSLALGLTIAKYSSGIGLLNGALIALSANTLNLLDLRPGRAASVFWVGVIAVILASSDRWILVVTLMPVLVPAVVLTVLDRSAKVMMGDAGSNVLGGVLGLSMAMTLGLSAKVIVIICLLGVNIYSEKRSISGLIESNRVLRGVDRLLGVR